MSSRWALPALPVLCCPGHALLLVVGVGSVTAVLGGAAGRDVVDQLVRVADRGVR